MVAWHIEFFIQTTTLMQNLQSNTTTLFDPSVESQGELFHFTERLGEGLPGYHGNVLLLLNLGIPTPSAGIIFPRWIRRRLNVQLYPDIDPAKDYIRHVRPREHDNNATPDSDAIGPMYRLHVSSLPAPPKHQVYDRIGRQRLRSDNSR